VFPFFDRQGNLVAAQGRCIDGQAPSKLSAGPIGQGVFATPGALDANPLVIVEAPICALSLALVGVPALALAGTGGKPWLRKACAFRRVLVATDADPAGDEAAPALAAVLAPLGARCERLRPQGAKDWNELLITYGPEALRAALAPILAMAEELARPLPAPPPAPARRRPATAMPEEEIIVLPDYIGPASIRTEDIPLPDEAFGDLSGEAGWDDVG